MCCAQTRDCRENRSSRFPLGLFLLGFFLLGLFLGGFFLTRRFLFGRLFLGYLLFLRCFLLFPGHRRSPMRIDNRVANALYNLLFPCDRNYRLIEMARQIATFPVFRPGGPM